MVQLKSLEHVLLPFCDVINVHSIVVRGDDDVAIPSIPITKPIAILDEHGDGDDGVQ